MFDHPASAAPKAARGQSAEPNGLVVSRLIGGLGNQMFQYAAGRALALRRGGFLRLDLSELEAGGRRRFELHNLPIEAIPATKADLANFPNISNRRFGRIGRLLRHVSKFGAGNARVYQETHFHFDPAMAELPTPVCLVGYWQSDKYFRDHAETIRRELTPAQPFDQDNAALADRIDAENAVSVHVRRGDYAADPTTRRYHGTCPADYYQRAVDYVAARVGTPHLFVFSDDAGWPRDNLRFGVPTTFVRANPPSAGYRDMQLMLRCRHHVIANSSFSWWGAWLNPQTDKIVVAPRRWFNASANDTRDLIPDQWVRL